MENKTSRAALASNARYARLKTRSLSIRFTNSVELESLAFDYIKKQHNVKQYVANLVIQDMQKDLIHKYGMKLRQCGPGCQPKGFVKCENLENADYYSFIWYDHELTEDEVKQFDLEYLGLDLK